LPKVGPLRAFDFNLPTPQTEAWFVESFRQSQVRYGEVLDLVRAGVSPVIPNENFDTGKPVHWGDYGLADRAFTKLVHQLAGKRFRGVDANMRRNLLEFSVTKLMLPSEVAADLAGLKAVVP